MELLKLQLSNLRNDQLGDWKVGSYFKLAYVGNRRGSDHHGFQHRFWSSYPGDPCSYRVRAADTWIDLRSTFQIESLANCYVAMPSGHCVWFFAAKVELPGGEIVWTNLGRNDETWAVEVSSSGCTRRGLGGLLLGPPGAPVPKSPPSGARSPNGPY